MENIEFTAQSQTKTAFRPTNDAQKYLKKTKNRISDSQQMHSMATGERRAHVTPTGWKPFRTVHVIPQSTQIHHVYTGMMNEEHIPSFPVT